MIKIIKSDSNSVFKHLKSLQNFKHRIKCDEFLCEGTRLVKDVLNSKYSVQKLAISHKFLDKNREFVESINHKDIYLFPDALFKKISLTENSQGIIATIKTPKHNFDIDSKFILILENIRDPGNLGSIIRTSEAVNVSFIVLNDCCEITNPKVIRSTMGSILRIKFCKNVSIHDIKKWGYKIFSTCLSGTDIQNEKFSGKIAIIIGSESFGLSKETLALSDKKIKIPMSGNIESLNASVAAGVILYFAKFDRVGLNNDN